MLRLRLLLLVPLLTSLALPASVFARDPRAEVRIGLLRTLGAGLALGTVPLAESVPDPGDCSDPGWLRAAPPERAPAHRGAYPYVRRLDRAPCPSAADGSLR